ncbi:MAG: sigma 54-interacting transcriptional regulator, partial [Patescibacteria group bacterium]
MSKKDKSELISFEEYLSRVKADPSIVKNAHARIYEAIIKKGFKIIGAEDDERLARALGLNEGEKITKYEAFADFYDIERTLEKIVAYFKAAKSGGEASRLFLFLLGPPSSGKSSLVRAIFSALQDEEIYYIEGCPIREEPLNLIPRKAREQIETELKVKVPHNGDICSVCRKRVKEEFRGDYKKFAVKKHHISVRASRFFASVDPTDPMSFDKAKFIGGVTLGEKEGDPSAHEMDGAFHRANRGLLEIVEIFKNTPEVLYLLLEATQSKTIESPAGRTEKIFIDVAIIAHSNEAEWEKFISEKRNEALIDRLILVKVPYNIRLDEQIRIYEKICGRNGYHIAPQTLEVLAAFTVLTRIKPSAKIKNLIDKMRIYNGEDVGIDLSDVNELKNESPDDGMFGLSNRDGAQIFEMAFANQPPSEHICVDAPKILKIAAEFVKEYPILGDEEKNKYLNVLDGVRNWCAEKIVRQFASFSDCFPEVC